MGRRRQHLNYYYWLQNEEYAQECKEKLVILYENYYNEKNLNKKSDIYKQLEVYLQVVCDIIAYRYLVKHYTNLFHKLCITVEEYMEYKVKRLLVTIKDKKEHIEDILSYIYMSFMLSSPRLIYDYGEKVGRCKLVKENLPYYQVARNKFFNNSKKEDTEHVIYNVDALYLDDTENNEEHIRSNIDKYSYSRWRSELSTKEEGTNDYQFLLDSLNSFNCNNENSRIYLLNIFSNWKDIFESDYQTVKIEAGFGNTYSLLDYIKYNYENCRTNLSHEEYIEVLKLLNKLLKIK